MTASQGRDPSASGDALRILVDGRDQGWIPVGDRGLHYGDGLFETIRIRDEKPCLWNRHWARLCLGAGRLGLPLPPAERLMGEARRAVAGLDEGILKLIITRGAGGRGYRPPSTPKPRRILLSYAGIPEDPSLEVRGVSVRYCKTPASVNPHLAGIKHLNRLDAVLARHEWDDPDIAEGLMREEGGAIVGGTMTNLFLWDGIGLSTPLVNRSGIAGTVRGLVLELATRHGIPCVERSITADNVERAIGLFLTNARIGVWPVCRLGGQTFDPDHLPGQLLGAIRQAAQTSGWPDPE
jgi:4-amino-4-deoxychorismate lyase